MVTAVLNGLMITASCKPISRIKSFQPIVLIRLARMATPRARRWVTAVTIVEMTRWYLF